MFTFIVTCYQQADMIPLALESVRYQIERYGQGQSFQLIVTDDGSTDGSRDVIRRWTEKNRRLFAEADLLFQEENAGICQNYVDALRHVRGERFIVLNGDDLFSSHSVFAFTDRLAEYDIVTSAAAKFTGSGKPVHARHTVLEMVLQNFITGKSLHNAVKLGCPIMGYAIYRKSLLTEDIFDFILRFRTVNDRACFQKILDQNAVKTCYINRPIILCRISENSISNFNSPSRILHNQEISDLCRTQRKTEKSFLFRSLLFWQEKSISFRKSPYEFIRFLRFFSPYFIFIFWIYCRNFLSIKKMEQELIHACEKECETHYKNICTRASGSLL